MILREIAQLAAEAPLWARALRRWWVVLHRLRRFGSGLYRVAPFSSDIYTPDSPRRRVHLDITNPSFLWEGRVDWRS